MIAILIIVAVVFALLGVIKIRADKKRYEEEIQGLADELKVARGCADERLRLIDNAKSKIDETIKLVNKAKAEYETLHAAMENAVVGHLKAEAELAETKRMCEAYRKQLEAEREERKLLEQRLDRILEDTYTE